MTIETGLPPWTDDRAAWIRENVWSASMRKTNREVPAFHSTCACQFGMTSYCQREQCGQCHRAEPQSGCETYLTNRREQVISFGEPYEHPTPSITGPRRMREAMVWLADRVCRWVCPCQCHAPAVIEAPPGPLGEPDRPQLLAALPGFEHLASPRAEGVTIAHFASRRRGRGDRRRTPSAPATGEALVTLAECGLPEEADRPREPVRIQRRRVAGWRLPPTAVIVDRTSKWGNPWCVEVDRRTGRARVFALGHRTRQGQVILDETGEQVEVAFHLPPEQAHRSAVARYRNYLRSRPDLVTLAQVELAGRDLARPCSPELPCHVDGP